MWNYQSKREFTALQVGFADEYGNHAKPGRKRPCLRVSSRELSSNTVIMPLPVGSLPVGSLVSSPFISH